MDSTDNLDPAQREEARLAKTMARRGVPVAKFTAKSTASLNVPGNSSAAPSDDLKSRGGAPLLRSNTHTPSSSSAVTFGRQPSDAPSTEQSTAGASDLPVRTNTSGSLGPAPTGSLQKSPSFGSSRNIVTRTTSTGPPSSQISAKPATVVDEEALRRREAEFDAERERLRQVEQDLIRNGKNALGDMAEINSEADRHEKERLARMMREAELDKKSAAPKPSPAKQPAPAASPAKKPAPASSSNPADFSSANKALIDDVDALLAQLNHAASQVPASTSNANQTGPQSNTILENAKAKLRTRKASIPAYVTNALGATAPENIDVELARYIREIVASMSPVQTLSSQVPLNEDNLQYDIFANHLDAMLLAIMKDVHLLLDHHSRELISNYSMELIDKANVLLQDVHEQSWYLKHSSTPQGSSSAGPDDVILSSQNKFILFLKHLAQTLTTAAQKQAEEIQAKKDTQTALSVCVQETATHAQALAQILKEPLFEPQAFKDRLASLVTTIKRAAPLIPPGPTHNQVMDSTRKVLEASLVLQQTNQAPGETSPHMVVFQAMGELLRALLSTIQK